MITKEQWKEITNSIRKFRQFHYKVYFNGKEIVICPKNKRSYQKRKFSKCKEFKRKFGNENFL